MNRPKSVTCPICGREYMKHSFQIHFKQCQNIYKKWEGNKEMPVARCSERVLQSQMQSINTSIDEDFRLISSPLNAPPMKYFDNAVESLKVSVTELDLIESPLLQCAVCSRCFSIDAISRSVYIYNNSQ